MSDSLDPVHDRHYVGPDLGVQTVCKGCQQTTKVTTNKEKVKDLQNASICYNYGRWQTYTGLDKQKFSV